MHLCIRPTVRSFIHSFIHSFLISLFSDVFDEGNDCELVPLTCFSEEFQTVSKRFHETIPEWKASTLMVEKISNSYLRERYNR